MVLTRRSIAFCMPKYILVAVVLFIFTVMPYFNMYISNNVQLSFQTSEQSQDAIVNSIELFPEPFALGNIRNFTFVLNRDICQGEPVDLLLLVGSHPEHSDMRKVLRETWGAPRADKYIVKLMFPIGRPNDPLLQQQMLDESAAYGDVVQGSFKDDYSAVTIRDLMSLHWTWKQCPQARFVMHIDDDISMDIDHMLDALEEQMPKDKDYVACFSHFIGGEVLRSGRYGLTKEEHPAPIFDPYCSGWGYWLTTRAAKHLDDAALRHFPYRINDAYLTGTLMTALGWKHFTLNISVTMDPVDFQNYLNSSENTIPKYFMGYNDLNATFSKLIHEKFRMFSKNNGIPRNGRRIKT